MVLRRSASVISLKRPRRSSAFDLIGGADELEAGGGEGDALAQFLAVPEVGRTVAGLDEDHRLLAVVDDGRLGGLLLADAGAVGAVEDVVLGDLEVALAHELLLDEVLDLLDADDGLAEVGHAAGDGGGDALRRGRRRRSSERKAMRTATAILSGIHGTTMAVAAHEAGGHGRGLAGDGDGGTAGEEQALGDVVAVVAHEGVLDGLEHHGVGDAGRRRGGCTTSLATAATNWRLASVKMSCS